MVKSAAPKVPTRARAVFSRQLRSARLAAGMTQVELAAAAGVSRPHLSKIETGTENPSLDLAAALARAVGADLADLLLSSAPKKS